MKKPWRGLGLSNAINNPQKGRLVSASYYLTETQIHKLGNLSEKTHVSRSEHLRQALERYLEDSIGRLEAGSPLSYLEVQ